MGNTQKCGMCNKHVLFIPCVRIVLLMLGNENLFVYDAVFRFVMKLIKFYYCLVFWMLKNKINFVIYAHISWSVKTEL